MRAGISLVAASERSRCILVLVHAHRVNLRCIDRNTTYKYLRHPISPHSLLFPSAVLPSVSPRNASRR